MPPRGLQTSPYGRIPRRVLPRVVASYVRAFHLIIPVGLAIVGAAAVAAADSPRCQLASDDVWEPQAVRWPVKPDSVEPVAPWVGSTAAELTDPVEVTLTRAAALWIPAVTMKRLRIIRGELADLRLSRVSGSIGSRIIVDEAGVVNGGGVELAEPIGPGSLWVIAARVPTTIVVERVDRRQPRLAWEAVRDALYAWIDAIPNSVAGEAARLGGTTATTANVELPPLPTDDGGGTAIRMLGARALIASQLSPIVRSAVQLWLRTQVELTIATLRPGDDPYVAHHTVVPDGLVTTDVDDTPYGPSPPTGRPWRLELTGPGVLVVDARATVAEALTGGDATVEVRRDGNVVARADEAVAPVMTVEPGAALPGLPAGVEPRKDGELGRKIRAVVPLALGAHVYDIAVNGAGLVRADVRRRSKRLREALSERPERDARWLQAKFATVADPLARAIADRFLASALGTSPTTTLTATTPAAVLAQLVATPGQLEPALARSLIATVTALVRKAYGDLERAIILELAQRIPDGVDATSLVAELLAPGRPAISSALLAALAPHLTGGTRSDAVAAAELAWRQNPTGFALRDALLTVAGRTALQRIDPVGEGVTRVLAARWLVAGANFQAAPSATPRLLASIVADQRHTATNEMSRNLASLAELTVGQSVNLDLPPHHDEPDRLAVVRVYVATPDDAPGPVRIAFDDGSQSLLALRKLEVVEFAASAGQHRIQVDAPPNTRVFVGAPRRVPAQPNGKADGAASVVQRWPVDGTVVYTLPTPRAIGPVRIELLGFTASQPQRHVVWLHSDLGPPRRLTFDVRMPDATSWSLDDDSTAAPPAAIWLWLPPGTRTFWLTTDGGPLYARVSVHGPAGASVNAVPQDLPPPLPRAVNFDRVAELSAALAAHPDSAKNYLDRAKLLLELGEVGAARRDLAAAAPRVRDQDRVAYDDTRLLLDTVAEPSYLPVQPPGGRIRSGVEIGAPTTPYVAELVSFARRVRHDGAAASWAAIERGDLAIQPSSPGQRMAAAIAQRARQSRAASERWLGIGSWQAQAAALVELRKLLDDGVEAVAPLAYGIAGELDDVVTPALQRARSTAARTSRWERVRNTAANAGFESLSTVLGQFDEPDAIALRRALLGAPWRDAVEILEPGRATTLSIEGPRKVAVRTWCRRLWPAELPTECRIASVLDQTAPNAIVVPHGEVRSIDVDVPAGVHEIEVGLGADDSTAMAAVRFADASESTTESALPTVRPTRVFLSAADRPAEIVVAGPGAVGVEIRGYSGRGESADIAVTGPDHERRVPIVVDQTPAPETTAVPGRAVAVTRPVTRTILLPTAGAYTIRVTPPASDVVAVRFATRVATTLRADYTVDRQIEVAGDGLPWPTVVPQPALVADRESDGRWIPSVEAVIGQDSLAALDSDFAALDLRFELAAQLRRRDRERSWFVELRGRQSGPLGPTGRFRAVGEFRGLPLGFAASVDARAAMQTTSEGTLWLARVLGDVSRPVLLNARWQLVPQLLLSAATFGPEVVPFGADPLVASTYRRSHPSQAVEGLELTGRPWADQFLAIGFNMRSNDSLVSIDAISAQVMWRGLFETSPRRGGIVMLEYAPTLRFANDFRAYTFLRHDLAAEVSWPWAIAGGRYGRLAVTLRGDLYPPTNISQTAHAVTLRLRWDGWHPGERNRMPSEEPLSDFIDQVSWAGRR